MKRVIFILIAFILFSCEKEIPRPDKIKEYTLNGSGNNYWTTCQNVIDVKNDQYQLENVNWTREKSKYYGELDKHSGHVLTTPINEGEYDAVYSDSLGVFPAKVKVSKFEETKTYFAVWYRYTVDRNGCEMIKNGVDFLNKGF